MRVSHDSQSEKAKQARAEGFNLDKRDMEELIGGSSLDDLRNMMGLIDFKYNEDILFRLIDATDIDLSDREELPKGKTYLARCTAMKDIPDYRLVPDNRYAPEEEYSTWVPVE